MRARAYALVSGLITPSHRAFAHAAPGSTHSCFVVRPAAALRLMSPLASVAACLSTNARAGLPHASPAPTKSGNVPADGHAWLQAVGATASSRGEDPGLVATAVLVAGPSPAYRDPALTRGARLLQLPWRTPSSLPTSPTSEAPIAPQPPTEAVVGCMLTLQLSRLCGTAPSLHPLLDALSTCATAQHVDLPAAAASCMAIALREDGEGLTLDACNLVDAFANAAVWHGCVAGFAQSGFPAGHFRRLMELPGKLQVDSLPWSPACMFPTALPTTPPSVPWGRSTLGATAGGSAHAALPPDGWECVAAHWATAALLRLAQDERGLDTPNAPLHARCVAAVLNLWTWLAAAGATSMPMEMAAGVAIGRAGWHARHALHAVGRRLAARAVAHSWGRIWDTTTSEEECAAVYASAVACWHALCVGWEFDEGIHVGAVALIRRAWDAVIAARRAAVSARMVEASVAAGTADSLQDVFQEAAPARHNDDAGWFKWSPSVRSTAAAAAPLASGGLWGDAMWTAVNPYSEAYPSSAAPAGDGGYCSQHADVTPLLVHTAHHPATTQLSMCVATLQQVTNLGRLVPELPADAVQPALERLTDPHCIVTPGDTEVAPSPPVAWTRTELVALDATLHLHALHCAPPIVAAVSLLLAAAVTAFPKASGNRASAALDEREDMLRFLAGVRLLPVPDSAAWPSMTVPVDLPPDAADKGTLDALMAAVTTLRAHKRLKKAVKRAGSPPSAHNTSIVAAVASLVLPLPITAAGAIALVTIPSLRLAIEPVAPAMAIVTTPSQPDSPAHAPARTVLPSMSALWRHALLSQVGWALAVTPTTHWMHGAFPSSHSPHAAATVGPVTPVTVAALPAPQESSFLRGVVTWAGLRDLADSINAANAARLL